MPVKNHRAADYLKTPEDIVAYLNAAIEEMGDDPRLLMKAFRNLPKRLAACRRSHVEPTWIALHFPVCSQGNGSHASTP